MTAQDIITSALRLIGVIAQGEAPSSDDAMGGLLALNIMLDNWAARRLLTPGLTKESFPIGPPAPASYAVGPGAAFDTAKPEAVLNAYVRDGNLIDYPVEVITPEEYDRLSDKATLAGTPSKLFYDPAGAQASVGAICLYPLPGSLFTLIIESLKPFAEFATLTDSFTFPAAYARAMKYNLAVELAPEYGAAVAPEVATVARESMQTIRNLNSVVEVAKYEFRRARRYDVNAG